MLKNMSDFGKSHAGEGAKRPVCRRCDTLITASAVAAINLPKFKTSIAVLPGITYSNAM